MNLGPPPHDLVAERSVISGVLLDNDALDLVTPILAPDDYYAKPHARIFEVMCQLHAGGAPLDTVTLQRELAQHGLLRDAGGIEYLLEITNSIPFVANIESHAQIVHECAALRRLRAVCLEVAAGTAQPMASAAAFIDAAEGKLFGASALRRPGQSEPERVGLIIERRRREVAKQQQEGRRPGIDTGIVGLDFLLKGLRRGHLYVLAGQAGMGKTAASGTIGVNVAARAQGAVLWWTGEMPRDDVGDRVWSAWASVDGNRIRGADPDADDWQRLTDACGETQRLRLFVDDTPAITMQQLRAKARRLKAAEGDLALIVVDYLQLMRTGMKHDKREEEVAALSRGLKALAQEIGCSVLAISTLVKEDRNSSNKRPVLRDLRESGMIGFDANAVIFLYRDEYYHPDNTTDAGVTEINVAKQRSGPTGIVRARFFPEYTRIDNLEDWDRPAPPAESKLEKRALAKQARKQQRVDDAPHPADTTDPQQALPGAAE